jgi:hypothetical protein
MNTLRHVLSLMTMTTLLSGCLLLCGTPVNTSGGEGEGEGVVGEGEGEGIVAEGEGEGIVAEGEGEGIVAGEGEGEVIVGEGEGEVLVGEGEGEPQPVGQCSRDGDCGAGQLCRFAIVAGARVLQCQAAPAAGGDNGAACTADAQCLHGNCTPSGLCAEPCVAATDCAGLGQRCFPNGAISFDDGTTVVAQACGRDNTLPALACTSDAVCAPTGRVCNDFVEVPNTTNYTLKCGFPGVGAALYGTCTGQFFFEADVCVSGLCTASANGQGLCTKTCLTTAECGAGAICTGQPFNNIAGDYCAQACEVSSQCPAGTICRTRVNAAGNALDTICEVPNPTGCATGLNFGNGVCGTLCRTTADCTGGLVCDIATVGGGNPQAPVSEDMLVCQSPQ